MTSCASQALSIVRRLFIAGSHATSPVRVLLRCSIARAGIRRVPLLVCCALVLGAVWSPAAAIAVPAVLLDQTTYTVAPGEIFDVTALIDGDLGTPDIQPLTNGLFSFGFQLDFPTAMASANSVTVVPELDFFGFAPGALTAIAAGLAKAEGNVDQTTADPYTGAPLAKISLTNLGNPGDSYLLQLVLAPHFPTEDIFLDGEGNLLDDVIFFGSARVFVTPEPGTIGTLALGAALALLMRNRFTRRP